jgi:hypothetical protein
MNHGLPGSFLLASRTIHPRLSHLDDIMMKVRCCLMLLRCCVVQSRCPISHQRFHVIECTPNRRSPLSVRKGGCVFVGSSHPANLHCDSFLFFSQTAKISKQQCYCYVPASLNACNHKKRLRPESQLQLPPTPTTITHISPS